MTEAGTGFGGPARGDAASDAFGLVESGELGRRGEYSVEGKTG